VSTVASTALRTVGATVASTALRTVGANETLALSDAEFDELIRQHQRRVYGVLFSLTRDEDAANTLTQECFFKAYQSLGTFRGECRIDTWLLRIAVNLARDHHKNRKARFWRRLVGLDDGEPANHSSFVAANPSAERSLIAQEEVEAVWKAVASLSQQQKEIFVLRFREELPLAEIAEVLGLQVGSVKSHLFRAISGVRKRVKDSTWR
jgi:RNA polymerase sigma-70 factor (ECF subfamily)